ncbi:WD40 repeat-like protein [Ascobolus immersus RN42]|uniref:WD40 repeat-like protein n=1 Tax=Ascobolus immersus RN42 TaxID=1160509 RepID=A0A3N4HY24_ASCIM|nr:WD40 repeat-like protein [Ascobolus immersus RN42]
MKVGFKFSNLVGTVYHQGNLLFTPDGNSLLSPVGNRVTCFDLVNNKSFTFDFEHRKNIARLALSPQATLLLTVDEDGRAILTNFVRRTVIHYFNFKNNVYDIKFSPDGRYFAVGVGRKVEVWKTPDMTDVREFAPFIKHREYTGHYDNITHITWSGDGRFFLAASKDMTAKVFSLDPVEGFVPTSMAGHKDSVIGAYFSKDQETIYTVSKDGALFAWRYKKLRRKDAMDEDSDSEDDSDMAAMRWQVDEKHYFNQHSARVKCATFHPDSNLLIVGFSNGVFGLYELPDFNMIHTLSISQNAIDFVTINKTGEWLAFGASKLGQLLVWEWQSESYILKQQGHFDAMNCLAYSPDGQRLVTGADDGKIKVWDTQSGFCVVTFTEHTSGVTAAEFAKKGNVLFTASLDGSIRAWDLVRYRNFRTFTAPERLQFTSLAVDPSGEVVCAGSMDSFDIHLWSVQTGQLLDSLAGHEGPVSTLSFTPDGATLASGSWDRSVRVWDIFSRTANSEPFMQTSDVLSVAFRPDSKELAIATLDGNLAFWSIETGEQTQLIDGRSDISGGRKVTDRRTAANNTNTKHFNNIVYSADGQCVLGGGNSKYICLYDVVSGSLLRRFTVSQNLSLDGTQEILNSKNLTEAGPLALIDTTGEASDLEDRIDNTLPGAAKGDLSVRKVRPEVRVTGVQFGPTGSNFAAASTEGLLIYSLDNITTFDPFDLDMDITPDNIVKTINSGDHLKALVMAFRLNSNALTHRVFESVPSNNVELLIEELPQVYLSHTLRLLTRMGKTTPHVEFVLLWVKCVFAKFGEVLLSAKKSEYAVELRELMTVVKKIQKDIQRVAQENAYMVDYLLESHPIKERNVVGIEQKPMLQIEGVSEDEEMGDDMEGDSLDESGMWTVLQQA